MAEARADTPDEILRGLVGFWTMTDPPEFVGNGFLVGDRLVMTAAHVMERADDQGRLEVKCWSDQNNRRACFTTAWRRIEDTPHARGAAPMDAAVAIIDYRPTGARNLRLQRSDVDLTGRTLLYTGFEIHGVKPGVDLEARVLDGGDSCYLPIDHAPHEGLSGSALRDDKGLTVAIMVWRRTDSDRGYILPVRHVLDLLDIAEPAPAAPNPRGRAWVGWSSAALVVLLCATILPRFLAPTPPAAQPAAPPPAVTVPQPAPAPAAAPPADAVVALPDAVIMGGTQLNAGYAMNVDTGAGKHDWLSRESDGFKLAFPAGEAWAALFVTVGKPGRAGNLGSRDISQYRALSLELKGARGNETVEIGIRAADQPADGYETRITTRVSAAWQKYSFPLDKFLGNGLNDLKSIHVITEVVNPDAEAKTVHLRNIELIR